MRFRAHSWRRFSIERQTPASTASNLSSAPAPAAAISIHNSAVFWCDRVVFPDQVEQGTVVVENGTIVATRPGDTLGGAKDLAAKQSYMLCNLGADGNDYGQQQHKNSKTTKFCLSPGLIDVHVHISELGRDWEGYASATKAASAGGITTIIGMPLNSIPATTSVESFEREREAAEHTDLFADVALWGGVVPGNCNESDLSNLLDAGVAGLKAFLSPLPPAAGFEAVSPAQLMQAADICGRHNKPILVHSELMTEADLQQHTENAFDRLGAQSYEAHVQSRPSQWERDAVEVVCAAAALCNMHIVHLSDAVGCLPIIQKTKESPETRGLTVETCPHYLMFDSSMIQDGDTRMKCFPPIRDPANRECLWEGVDNGLIDMVASDHSPCEPSMRFVESGDMRKAWGGLSALQYQLQMTWTEARRRGYTPLDMARWWSRNPSALSNMVRKGAIEVGKQADLCWWDTESVDGCQGREYHRWPGTTSSTDKASLRGRVLGTWLNGRQVYDGTEDRHLDANGEFLVS